MVGSHGLGHVRVIESEGHYSVCVYEADREDIATLHTIGNHGKYDNTRFKADMFCLYIGPEDNDAYRAILENDSYLNQVYTEMTEIAGAPDSPEVPQRRRGLKGVVRRLFKRHLRRRGE